MLALRYLTDHTIRVHITPLVRTAVDFLSGLDGNALKAETKIISKSNCLLTLIESLKEARPYVGDVVKIEPSLHLDILLKMIKGSTVDGVM